MVDDDLNSESIDVIHQKNESKYKEENKNCATHKGDENMPTQKVMNPVFQNEVLGFSELRNNISEVIGRVVNKFNIVVSGNVRKSKTDTAVIIAEKLLDDILSVYKFNPEIGYDEDSKQFYANLDIISAYGCGNTREEAEAMLIQLALELTKEYFDNVELYARMPEQKEKLPYYLRIRQCRNIEELRQVLNLV